MLMNGLYIVKKLSFITEKIKYLFFYKQSACDNTLLKLPTITFNSIDGAIYNVRTLK